MQIVETYPIGTKVFYFIPSFVGEPEIKESVVIGSFVHKTRGELHYNLIEEAVEAYAVRTTREEIEEQKRKFEEVRAKLLEANAEHKKRVDELLWCGQVYSDYSIDNLTKEKEVENG